MISVGLLYVGAALLINGLVLLRVIPASSAAIPNICVGALQVLTPTIVIIQARGDAGTILAASGLYLFGFTYLHLGILNITGGGPEGLGWFSLFVAVSAVVYVAISVQNADWIAAVIWAASAYLWGLFFALLGLRRALLGTFVGWVATLYSVPLCLVPAFYTLARYDASEDVVAVGMASALLVATGAAAVMSRRGRWKRATNAEAADP